MIKGVEGRSLMMYVAQFLKTYPEAGEYPVVCWYRVEGKWYRRYGDKRGGGEKSVMMYVAQFLKAYLRPERSLW